MWSRSYSCICHLSCVVVAHPPLVLCLSPVPLPFPSNLCGYPPACQDPAAADSGGSSSSILPSSPRLRPGAEDISLSSRSPPAPPHIARLHCDLFLRLLECAWQTAEKVKETCQGARTSCHLTRGCHSVLHCPSALVCLFVG